MTVPTSENDKHNEKEGKEPLLNTQTEYRLFTSNAKSRALPGTSDETNISQSWDFSTNLPICKVHRIIDLHRDSQKSDCWI